MVVVRVSRPERTALESDPEEFANREQSDFLNVKNHEDESLDFHALRHTCGGWLAKAGAHPKSIQSVMRHSRIVSTRTHTVILSPARKAETVARFSDLRRNDQPNLMRATGTTEVKVGDSDQPSEKRSRRLKSAADGAAILVLRLA